jgi:hypothetical protein
MYTVGSGETVAAPNQTGFQREIFASILLASHCVHLICSE